MQRPPWKKWRTRSSHYTQGKGICSMSILACRWQCISVIHAAVARIVQSNNHYHRYPVGSPGLCPQWNQLIHDHPVGDVHYLSPILGIWGVDLHLDYEWVIMIKKACNFISVSGPTECVLKWGAECKRVSRHMLGGSLYNLSPSNGWWNAIIIF